MDILKRVFILVGILLLAIAAINKLFVSHHLLMGVKLLNLIVLANSCFAMSILIKLHQKK